MPGASSTTFVHRIPTANHILSELQKVYFVDKEAKKLPDGERLAMHLKSSKPTMDGLHQWMHDQFEHRNVEPNSPLGKAVIYYLERWPELTRFLEVPGTPISNSDTEQAIKWAICHRKNSLFYKTQNGAMNDDIIQSIIKTCNSSSVNSFDYLVALQENRSRVYAYPELFLLPEAHLLAPFWQQLFRSRRGEYK